MEYNLAETSKHDEIDAGHPGSDTSNVHHEETSGRRVTSVPRQQLPMKQLSPIDGEDVATVLRRTGKATVAGADTFKSPRSSTALPFDRDRCEKCVVPELNISFSGAGLCGFYFNGICQALASHRVRVGKVYGASAGAISALSLLLRVPPECHAEILALYDQHRECTPWILLKARDFVWESEMVKKHILPVGDPDRCLRRIREELNGRLHVAVTRVCGFDRASGRLFVLPQSVTISEWHDRSDLVDCIRATMTIPGLTAFTPLYWRGAYWADGGLLNMQPLPDSPAEAARVVVVTPWFPCHPWQPSWTADVHLFRHFPLLHGAIHTSLDSRRAMFDAGAADAVALLQRLAARSAAASGGKPDGTADAGGAASSPSAAYTHVVRPLARALYFVVLEGQFAWKASGAAGRWARAGVLRGELERELAALGDALLGDLSRCSGLRPLSAA